MLIFKFLTEYFVYAWMRRFYKDRCGNSKIKIQKAKFKKQASTSIAVERGMTQYKKIKIQKGA